MIVRTPWKRLIGIGVFSLLMWMSRVAMGQAVNGTLLGTVTDVTGAAVPNAKVPDRPLVPSPLVYNPSTL